MKLVYLSILAILAFAQTHEVFVDAQIRTGVVDPSNSGKQDNPFGIHKGRPFKDHEDDHSAFPLYKHGVHAVRDEQPDTQTQPAITHQDAVINNTSQLSVWQVIENNPELTKLKSMMEQGFYSAILEAPSAVNYTVFAATDSAWAMLSDSIQQAMNGPFVRVVTNAILQYQIVANATITSSDNFDGGPLTVETVSGYTLSVSKINGTLSVNEVPVHSGDLLATNGVVHLIDSVLLPSQQSLN
ncbi:FAS1 domain-containing protein [Umbelopsis sp. PMI_123]|nr:FAS1 domain-containing protein [Umbelopsis sp. PMI_123]